MTEYDFSPEAYERFVATQQRIARWVHQTEEHRPQFRHAVPTHYPPRSSSPSSRSSSSSSSESDYDRPRSKSALASYPLMPPRPPLPGQSFLRPTLDSRHSHSLSHSESYRSPTYLVSPQQAPPLYQYSYPALPSLSTHHINGKRPSVSSTVTTPYYQTTPPPYPTQASYPYPAPSFPLSAPASAAYPYGTNLPRQPVYPSIYAPPRQGPAQAQYPQAAPPFPSYPYAGPYPNQSQPQIIISKDVSRRKKSKRSRSRRSY